MSSIEFHTKFLECGIQVAKIEVFHHWAATGFLVLEKCDDRCSIFHDKPVN